MMTTTFVVRLRVKRLWVVPFDFFAPEILSMVLFELVRAVYPLILCTCAIFFCATCSLSFAFSAALLLP